VCAERLLPTGICGDMDLCFVARNYMPRGIKGEIDLMGHDGETLAFVGADANGARGSSGAAGVELDSRETAPGGPDGAAIHAGTARDARLSREI
jgi:hypothetical protein